MGIAEPSETTPSTPLRRALPFLITANLALTTGLLLAFLPASERTHLWTWARLGGYAACLVLAPCLLLYLPLTRLPAARPALWWAVGEGLRAAALAVDLRLYRVLGVHLYSPQVLAHFHEEGFARDVGMNAGMLAELGALIAAGIAAQAVFWGLWRAGEHLGPKIRARLPPLPRRSRNDGPAAPRGREADRGRRPPWGLALWAVGIATLLGAHLLAPEGERAALAESVPLYAALHPAGFDRRADDLLEHKMQARIRALRYPRERLRRVDTKGLARPDIVLVLAESLRGDMFNPVDMPELTARADRAGGLRSRRHYSGGHQTWEGSFSLLYALYGHHRDTFRDLPLSPYPMQLLKLAGYETVALASGSLRHTGYAPMWKVFSRYESTARLGAIKGDRRITDRALELLGARRRGQGGSRDKAERKPMFVLLFYDSTHHPFLFPKAHATFKPYLPRNLRGKLLTHEEHRLRLWNRYRNAVRFVDSEIGRLWDGLAEARRAGELAFVFTGDHGEEFFDHGQYGHAKRGLNNGRVWTPLWLFFPGMARREVALSSHVDIFPTLFDLMALPVDPAASFDGRTLMRPRPAGYVQVNAYNFPRSAAFALVTPRRKIFARRTAGFELEINAVLDGDDRKIAWTLADVQGPVRRFMRDVDHFYPGFHLFESDRILQRAMPGYPLPDAPGTPRTPEHPELLPWARLRGAESFVSDTPIAVQHPIGARIGPYVELVGYNLDAPRPRMGDTIRIEYVYRCLKRVPRRLRFFYHLFLPEPPGYQNLDHAPGDGNLPLSRWRPGTWIRDPHSIMTLTNWTPGPAELRQGIYDRKTGKRLEITGGVSKSNSVLVTTLTLGDPR